MRDGWHAARPKTIHSTSAANTHSRSHGRGRAHGHSDTFRHQKINEQMEKEDT